MELSYKVLPIFECKATEAGGNIYLEGYANTKGVADRYGDVPTCFKRPYCYDLSEYQKNPVLLIDHVNKTDHVAGSMEIIKEDEKGLYFKARFSKSEHPNVAQARTVYSEGHAKGISIAGRFMHEDDENPEHLTLAKIYEISVVPVGADPNALAAAVSKALEIFAKENPATGGTLPAPCPAELKQQEIFKALQRLESGVTLSADELRVLRPWADNLRRTLYGTEKYFDPQEALRRLSDTETQGDKK